MRMDQCVYILILLQGLNLSTLVSVEAVYSKYLKDPSIYVFPPKDSQYNNKFADIKILVDPVHDRVYLSTVNKLFSLSSNLKSVLKLLDLPPTEAAKKKCEDEQLDKSVCAYSYIKTLTYDTTGRLFVCGTNAFLPLCYRFLRDSLVNINNTIVRAYNRCPDDKQYTALTYFSGNNIFVATQKRSSEEGSFLRKMKTFDEDILVSSKNQVFSMTYEATFKSVHVLDNSNYLYYFYHEIAEGDSGRKVIYSRVARVCKYDNGDPNLSAGRFVTFLKSHLICEKAGSKVETYYDIIESTYMTDVVINGKSEKFIYATFSSSVEGITNSAICRYRATDIVQVFETARFTYKNREGKWVVEVFSDARNAVSRPVCDGKKQNFNKTHQNAIYFASQKCMIYDNVKPYDNGESIYVAGSTRFTSLMLDKINTTAGNSKVEVLMAFAGTGEHLLSWLQVTTRNGYVHKLLLNNTKNVGAKLVKKIQPFEKEESIKAITKYQRMLYVVGETGVSTFPIQQCDNHWLCKDCIHVKDPYCAWSIKNNRCKDASKVDPADRIQDIFNGDSSQCPAVQKDFKCAASVSSVFGMTTLLECTVVADTITGEVPTINGWSRDDTRLFENDWYKMMNGNKNLLITQYNEMYAGKYSCIIQVKDSQSKSCFVVLEAPTTTKRPLISKITTRGTLVTNVTVRVNTTTTRPPIPYHGSGSKSYFKEFIIMAVLFAIVFLLLVFLFCCILFTSKQNNSEIDGGTPNGHPNGHFFKFTRKYKIGRQNSANKKLIRKKSKDRVYKSTTMEMDEKKATKLFQFSAEHV